MGKENLKILKYIKCSIQITSRKIFHKIILYFLKYSLPIIKKITLYTIKGKVKFRVRYFETDQVK